MNVFRAALSSDFWITGIAIARYIPRAFRTKQIDGNLVFTEEKRQEYRRRVESMTLNSRRKWGNHGSRPDPSPSQPSMRRFARLLTSSRRSYLISRTLFKWILVDWYSEQPVGLRLPTGFKIPHAQRFEFAYERGQLLKILEADWNAITAEQWM